jgi:hypothetical protein
MKFKLEKDIPIPAKQMRIRPSKYPFNKMEIGESFLVPLNKLKTIRTAIGLYKKKHPEWGYASRTLPEGFRIWRIK